MTEQVTEERRTDQINLSPVAAAKVSSLLEQEGRDDLALRVAVQPVAAAVCATSSSSTSAPSTVTSCATSTVSRSSSTG